MSWPSHEVRHESTWDGTDEVKAHAGMWMRLMPRWLLPFSRTTPRRVCLVSKLHSLTGRRLLLLLHLPLSLGLLSTAALLLPNKTRYLADASRMSARPVLVLCWSYWFMFDRCSTADLWMQTLGSNPLRLLVNKNPASVLKSWNSANFVQMSGKNLGD